MLNNTKVIYKPKWMSDECFNNIMINVIWDVNQSDMDCIFNVLKDGLILTDDAQDVTLNRHLSDAIGSVHIFLAHLHWMQSELNAEIPSIVKRIKVTL